jgi:hypothetical protein
LFNSYNLDHKNFSEILLQVTLKNTKKYPRIRELVSEHINNVEISHVLVVYETSNKSNTIKSPFSNEFGSRLLNTLVMENMGTGLFFPEDHENKEKKDIKSFLSKINLN